MARVRAFLTSSCWAKLWQGDVTGFFRDAPGLGAGEDRGLPVKPGGLHGGGGAALI